MGSNAAEEESTLIAIDSDQNSQHAVKWAVEYLFKNNSSCTLLHVRTKNLYHSTYIAQTHASPMHCISDEHHLNSCMQEIASFLLIYHAWIFA